MTDDTGTEPAPALDPSDAFAVTRETVADARAGAEPAALLLDVRRVAAFAQATTMLPGAQWRDPAEVERWVAAVPGGRPVFVYCIHGHEVSRSTVTRLRAAGLDAWFMQGGIDGWTAAGMPVNPKAPTEGRAS
jgi:Fe-Mn family superoxide dismutase